MLHHAFDTETSANAYIHSISNLLDTKGVWVISIPIHEKSFEKTTVTMDEKTFSESTVSKEVLLEICATFNLVLDTWLSYEDASVYYKNIYPELYEIMRVDHNPLDGNIVATFVKR